MSPGTSQAVGLPPEMCFFIKNIFPVLLGVMLGKRKIVCHPECQWAQRLCEQFRPVRFCSSSSLLSMISSQHYVVLLPNFSRIHNKEKKIKIKCMC